MPLYLFTDSYAMIVVFFGLQGWFAVGGIWSQAPKQSLRTLPDRGARYGLRVLLPPGAIWGSFASPVVTFFAINWHLGFAIPMAIGTAVGPISLLLALSVSPETRGKDLVVDVVLA